MKKSPLGLIVFLLIVASVVFSHPAMARQLQEVAETYSSIVMNVAKGVSICGIAVGCICMQLPGATFFGKNALTGGIIGCLFTFGADTFVTLMKTIFGTT